MATTVGKLFDHRMALLILLSCDPKWSLV